MGDSTTKVTSGGNSGAPQILPQLESFVNRIGQIATGAVDMPQLNIGRFAQDFTQQIPGLSPLQQGTSNQLQQWLQQGGMGTPYPGQVATQQLENLPGQVGQQVQQSPMFSQGLGTAQQSADVGNRFNQTQLAGLAGLGQFAGITPEQSYGGPLTSSSTTTPGSSAQTSSMPQSQPQGQAQPVADPAAYDFARNWNNTYGQEQLSLQAYANQRNGYQSQPPPLPQTNPTGSPGGAVTTTPTPTAPNLGSAQSWIGNTPAVQSAVQGLESTIVPRVQNEAARIGLGQSGFLPNEVGRQYAKELTPLYMQGMQQQQQAAQSMLGAGSSLQTNQLQTLQSLRDTQMALGQNQQALQTDAMMRQMQAAIGSASPLSQLSQQTTNQQMFPVLQGQQMGQTERSVQEQQSQADLQSYLRQRELGLSLINPFGSFPASGGVPSTTTKTTSSGTGFGK